MKTNYGLTGAVQTGPERPVLPADFEADALASSNSVTLSWDCTKADFDIMQLEYKTEDGDWTFIRNFSKEHEGFLHEGLEPSTRYYYRAKVRRRFKWSAYVTDDATTAPE